MSDTTYTQAEAWLVEWNCPRFARVFTSRTDAVECLEDEILRRILDCERGGYSFAASRLSGARGRLLLSASCDPWSEHINGRTLELLPCETLPDP